MSFAELMSKALKLPCKDRAELARRLIESLDLSPAEAIVEEAWNAEINRRLDRLDRGDAKLIDWRESVERARRAIGATDGLK